MQVGDIENYGGILYEVVFVGEAIYIIQPKK